MHLNQALMGSKAEEFSDENCHLGEANQYCDKSEGSSFGNRACERLKHAVSETSHNPGVSSTHDSLSENAENGWALSEKYQGSKCLGSLDDSTSCIGRTSNANLTGDSHEINTDRINISCSSTSVSRLGAEGSGNGRSVDMSGLSECCMENVDSTLTKEKVPIILPGEKSLADKENLNNSSAKVSIEICLKSEVDTENHVHVVKDEDHQYPAHDGLHEKVEELVKSPGRAEPQQEDENDESDVVEHDVKVCDICGDAGHEDLLAICCRCSDGAEHIYCMREILEKVPKGDWLCEECKCAEETANRRLDIEEKQILKVSSSSQIYGKRPSQSMDIATAVKRKALELSTGSLKASSPKRIVPLSRESSFKIVDKGKIISGQQIPMHNYPGGEIELVRSLSTSPRNKNTRSTLLKSNSFNFNSKLRDKLVDEVVPQKQRWGVEHISKNMETPTGTINKSMSFKCSNLGRSNAVDSKVKIISSKPVTVQDLKASRHAKESGSFDRKFMSKIDQPVICSTMVSSVVSTSKGDQKLALHDETTRPSTVNNNPEFKVKQDGKLYSLSKSVNNTSSKSLEPLVSADIMSTSVYEIQWDRLPQSQETTNQVDKTKDCSSNHVKSGVTNASKNSFYHKCKDFGHATESCMISSTQEFGAEASVIATSGSKEEMHKGNRLRAAIQAALLRRPEIQKKAAPDQTNEFPTLSTGLKCEVTSQNQMLISNTLKNSISAEETNIKQEINGNSTFETSKCPSANDVMKLKFCQTDFCSQLRKSDSFDPTSGKPLVRDFPNNAIEISSTLSKKSAIPEYEYIWQGVFKVHRNGKPPDLYTGIQAHLSACASPKVFEAVKKILPEVSLNEVSRLSTWPSQFHQGGATEDNIALYFFARDIESYERHYKGLLDHMIRNDLALRGIFDGVELVIFASNQLPEDSKCWNMLFYLWGIFRGRRINHSNSTQKICIPSLNVMPNEEEIPTVVTSLSETRCSPKHMDEKPVDQAQNNMRDSVPDRQPHTKSKSPKAIRTSVSSRVMVTKTDHDISVKQENSLPLGIPPLGCQEIDTASNINKDQILEKTYNDENQQRLKRKQMEDDLNINVEATFQGNLIVKGVNCQLPNDKKVQHIDLSDAVVEASLVSCQQMPWNEVNDKLEGKESHSKKLQTDFSGICRCYDSGARRSFNGNFASLVNDFGYCSSIEDKGRKEACDEKIIHVDFGTMERTFFPVDTLAKNESGMVLNSKALNGAHEFADQYQVGIPNLELALGCERKPPHKGMLPFLVGAVDKKNNREKTPDILTDEREDENVAASLSLSLSFPSTNKEEHTKSVSKVEPLHDGHNVNRSFLFFGRYMDK